MDDNFIQTMAANLASLTAAHAELQAQVNLLSQRVERIAEHVTEDEDHEGDHRL